MTLRLTPREEDVLELVGRQLLTYKAAARALGTSSTSLRSVASHLARRIPGDASPIRKLIQLARELDG